MFTMYYPIRFLGKARKSKTYYVLQNPIPTAAMSLLHWFFKISQLAYLEESWNYFITFAFKNGCGCYILKCEKWFRKGDFPYLLKNDEKILHFRTI